VAFVQICKGNSDDAGTYDEDERLVRTALTCLDDLLKIVRNPANLPAQPAPPAEGEVGDEVLPPRVGHILRLAEIIRAVDGNHDKGAAALAEAILSHPDICSAGLAAEGEAGEQQKASTAGLTVNIQIDPSPECFQRLFDGLNAAVKPDGGYRAQTTDDPTVQTGCEQVVGVECWLPQHGCDSLENTLDAIKGRILAAVFKWWPTAAVFATQPPAQGEVAELVEWLKENEAMAYAISDTAEERRYARAAELLSQRYPAPVPVSVRFEFSVVDECSMEVAGGDAPTYAEALSEGQHYLVMYRQDGPHTLELRRVEVLPAHALPLPAGEGS
jgi:hypothetical protein